jgi:probable F420-dependent oxidoreductase
MNPKIGVTIPVFNAAPGDVPKMAKAAEDAGLDSVWDYEIWRNPFIGLATAATSTSRVELGTALATALTRTPWVTANAAADLHDLSGGRLLLGLGTGDPFLLNNFHGIQLDRPLARMREYVEALRASWNYMATAEPGTFDGKFYQLTFPEFNPWVRTNPTLRDGIPILLAAARPKMIQLAGEIADGLVGYLYSLNFLKEVVHPNLEIGARRAGRDVSDVQLVSQTICSVHPDRDEAMRRARIHVGQYVTDPVSDGMTTAEGLQKEVQTVREAIMTEGPSAAEWATDDKLVDAFSISGTPDEARERLQHYAELLPHIMLHCPYPPPLTAEESADSFQHILDLFGR